MARRVLRIGSGTILAEIRQPIAVGILGRVRRIGRVQAVGSFPAVGHAVTIRVGTGRVGAEHVFPEVGQAIVVEVRVGVLAGVTKIQLFPGSRQGVTGGRAGGW